MTARILRDFKASRYDYLGYFLGFSFRRGSSCKLHRLDSEKYLAELIHVQPQWPHKRQLELTPKYWRETGAKLDEKSLEYGIGYIVVPDASGTRT